MNKEHWVIPFVPRYLAAVARICSQIDPHLVETMVDELVKLREVRGRLFILGVGGSAANASHAVNDFRKLCGIEAYAPTDNVAELTARTNDNGWRTIFSDWLEVSKLSSKDILLILSVGGGSISTSACLVEAINYALAWEAKILGVVGSKDGATFRYGYLTLVVPFAEHELMTAMTEVFQAVIWHCLVNHPRLKKA